MTFEELWDEIVKQHVDENHYFELFDEDQKERVYDVRLPDDLKLSVSTLVERYGWIAIRRHVQFGDEEKDQAIIAYVGIDQCINGRDRVYGDLDAVLKQYVMWKLKHGGTAQ